MLFCKYNMLVNSVLFFIVVILLCSVRGYPQRVAEKQGIPPADILLDARHGTQRIPDSIAQASQLQDREIFINPRHQSRRYLRRNAVVLDPQDLQPDIPDVEADTQNFYPSFYDYDTPLGHSRPYTFHQETAYSQRPYTPRQQQLQQYERALLGRFKDPRVKAASTRSEDLLGSGNFGVIRGGTFYNENDDVSLFGAGNNHQIYSPYYHNGHGRPSFYYTPKQTQQDQFANFRDFADINTPSNPAYSQYVVVYANKNATNGTPNNNNNNKNNDGNSDKFAPKNIMERLTMLDKESKGIGEEVPKKKNNLSESKKKLTSVPPEKKPWNPKEKNKLKGKDEDNAEMSDLFEPLLALS